MSTIDTLQNSEQGIVSGVGIKHQEQVSESHLNDLLQQVNSVNLNQFQQEEARLLEEQRQREEADNIARNEAHRQRLRERYEAEQKAKMQREKEEQEELERFQAELEKKKASNPFYKVAGLAKSIIQIPGSKKDILEDNNTLNETNNSNTLNIKTEIISKASSNNIEIKEDTKDTKDKKGLFNGFSKKKKESSEINNDNQSQEEPTTLNYEYLATHDEKTSLLNANAFKIALAKMDENAMTAICFDVNNLKYTNDTMGHSCGDKLLKIVAEGLDKCFPQNVYRTGGDEFIALLPIVNLKALDKRITQLKKYFENKSNVDTEGIVYAVSVGYCMSDGSLTKQEILDLADKRMYEDKRAYKQAHPELNARTETTKSIVKPQPEIPYDDKLNKSTRDMKMLIQEQHMLPDDESTERAMLEIQRRHNDVLYVLIADKKFNSFMIIQDVNTFLHLVVNKMDNLIDYSYLYVVYDDGYKYYGNDNLVPGVAKLFADIENTIRKSHIISEKDLLKIKGINVFKEIFIG